jgi:hypothetical protein
MKFGFKGLKIIRLKLHESWSVYILLNFFLISFYFAKNSFEFFF